jgi:hypothetical protein
MNERETFIEEFKKLLGTMPAHSFAEWLYAYRQVAHTMGVEILRRFPEEIAGYPPSRLAGSRDGEPDDAEIVIVTAPQQAGGPSGGAGGHPSVLCKLSCLIFDLYPEFARKLGEGR